MTDINVIRAAVEQVAARQGEVYTDHFEFPRYREYINGAVDTTGTANSAVARALAAKPKLLASAATCNEMGERTLAKLYTTLAETHTAYQQVEEESTELVARTARAWGGLADGSVKSSPTRSPRTDWSRGVASTTAGMHRDLPQNWDGPDLSQAIKNLDAGWFGGLPSMAQGIFDGFVHWDKFSRTLEETKDSWLPVFQLGKGLGTLGAGYYAIGTDMDHDRQVLITNWEGDGGEAASAALKNLAAWFTKMGLNMSRAGGAIQREAASVVAMHQQIYTLIDVGLGILREAHAVWKHLNRFIELVWVVVSPALLKEKLKAAIKATISLAITFLSLAKRILGVILSINIVVQSVLTYVDYATADGADSFEVPAPVWG